MNDSTPSNALDAQVDALLQRVNSDREQRCKQMLAKAESEVQEILRLGRAEARANVRRAVAQERSRTAQRLRQAEAGAELDARRRAQSETRKLLESMWTEIAEALEARWRNAEHRQAWVTAAMGQADLLLGTIASWNIEHGSGWLAEERGELEKFAAKRGAHTLKWVHDPALGAGLRIRCEGVSLDATTRGLLAHRANIESAFLAEYLALADSEQLPHE